MEKQYIFHLELCRRTRSMEDEEEEHKKLPVDLGTHSSALLLQRTSFFPLLLLVLLPQKTHHKWNDLWIESRAPPSPSIFTLTSHNFSCPQNSCNLFLHIRLLMDVFMNTRGMEGERGWGGKLMEQLSDPDPSFIPHSSQPHTLPIKAPPPSPASLLIWPCNLTNINMIFFDSLAHGCQPLASTLGYLTCSSLSFSFISSRLIFNSFHWFIFHFGGLTSS